MNLPLAHAADTIVNILYVLPLVGVLGVLGYQKLRDRRHGEPERAEVPRPRGPNPDGP